MWPCSLRPGQIFLWQVPLSIKVQWRRMSKDFWRYLRNTNESADYYGGNIDDDFAFSFLKNNRYDEVIAVDGGLAFADRAGIKITHLVGDFDTIDGAVLEKYIHREDICVHQFVPEKDYTDTDIAVKLAIELFSGMGVPLDPMSEGLSLKLLPEQEIPMKETGEKILHILGATGTRLDHVLANPSNVKEYYGCGN